MQGTERSAKMNKAGLDFISNHFCHSVQQAGSRTLLDSRMIVGLWRTRALSPDQKAQIIEDQNDYEERSKMFEDTECILDLEDTKMSIVYTAKIPVNTKCLMEMFNGGELEHTIMGKSCRLSELCNDCMGTYQAGYFERRVSYRFNRSVSIFGGEVACRQRKTPIANGEGWIIDEVMARQGVPFCDHFRVQLRYRIEKSSPARSACKCNVYVRVTRLKSTMFLERIKHNITEKFAHKMKDIFELVEREILLTPQQDIGL